MSPERSALGVQIYIHIPFCEQKCNYCRFASIGKIQSLHIEKYVNFLCNEINNNSIEVTNVSTIYFGGGTPGVLKIKQFEKILDTINNKYNLEKNCEISLETTPDKITKENLIGWEKMGINRISMGIQTFNEKSLIKIGRGNKGDVINALENFKKYNLIKNISVDFIIGLPYVSKGEILDDIKFVLSEYNFIKHISVYMLEDYYTPDKIIETKYDNITYPDDWSKQGIKEDEYLGEYSNIKQYLKDNEFNSYEISNYGKKGFECKHNIGYWNHNEILAFGLGAYGFINNTRYANADSFSNYYNGEKLLEDKLSSEDLFLEKVMFQLRTSGIEESIYSKLDTKQINYFIENLYLEKASLINNTNYPIINFHKGDEYKIKLTDKGVLVMDYILTEII